MESNPLLAPSGKKCTVCGGDIPVGRLKAQPKTTTCTGCSTTGRVAGHVMITGKTEYSAVQIVDPETAARLSEMGRRDGYCSSLEKFSDGDYSTEQCIFAWDFDLVAEEIKKAVILEIAKDFEDMPDEKSCKTVVEAHLVSKINKLIGSVS